MILQSTGSGLAGRLTFPYLDDTGSLGFTDLDVPTSGVFSQEDLKLLWDAGRRMADWKNRAAIAHATEFARPAPAGEADLVRNWHTVEACSRHARALLGSWPHSLDRRLTWQPVGVPGGTEDLMVTEREVDSLGHLSISGDQLTVGQSARWIGTSKPWRSATVAVVAQAVIGTALRSIPAEDHAHISPLLAPIAQVATIAEPPLGSIDLDPSSWPPAFGSFVSSCLRVITELEAASRGAGAIPLLDTDELYEAWLALRIWEMLESRLGPAEPGEKADACWSIDTTKLELWIKPVFLSSEPSSIGEEYYCAVGAQRLVPDLLLSATKDGETRLFVFDAKAWSTMQSEDALSEAAKYLYGIRFFLEDDRSTVPVIERVELVTSAKTPPVSSSDVARIGVITSTPTASPFLLDEALLKALALLDAEPPILMVPLS